MKCSLAMQVFLLLFQVEGSGVTQGFGKIVTILLVGKITRQACE